MIILGTPLMSILMSLVVAFAVALVFYLVRRGMRPESLDAGVVSARWLSELRRDEPWTRS